MRRAGRFSRRGSAGGAVAAPSSDPVLATLSSMAETRWFVGPKVIIVTGLAFAAGAKLLMNGSDTINGGLITTVVDSATQLTVTLPEQHTWEIDNIGVQVQNPVGSPSNALFYPITYNSAVIKGHWRPDAGITLAGANVQTWAELVGGDANKNAVQLTVANQPIFTASDAAYNGRPVLNAPSPRFMRTGIWAAPLAQPMIHYFVGEFGSTAAARFALDGDAGGVNRQIINQNATTGFLVVNAQNPPVTGTAAIAAGKHIIAARMNGASTAGYVDSLTASLSGTSGTVSLLGLTFGATSASSAQLAGKMAEYITQAGATLNASIMRYLAWRYAITLV